MQIVDRRGFPSRFDVDLAGERDRRESAHAVPQRQERRHDGDFLHDNPQRNTSRPKHWVIISWRFGDFQGLSEKQGAAIGDQGSGREKSDSSDLAASSSSRKGFGLVCPAISLL